MGMHWTVNRVTDANHIGLAFEQDNSHACLWYVMKASKLDQSYSTSW